MTKKQSIKSYYKRQKASQQNDVSIIQQSIKEYKSERKASWKLFKNNMELELKKIRTSLKTLKLHPGKKELEEYLLDLTGSSLPTDKGKSKIKIKKNYQNPVLTELSNSVPATHH